MDTTTKSNLKKLLYVFGICIFIATVVILTLKDIDDRNGKLDIGTVNNDITSIASSLGAAIDLPKIEADTLKCKKDKLPSSLYPTAGWRALCTNNFGIPFVGLFWKRTDYSANTFQNKVIEQLIQSGSVLDKTTYGSSTTCVPAKINEQTGSAKVTCTSVLTKKINLYTNFVYLAETRTINSTSVNRILVISGKDKKSVESRTSYLEERTKIINTTDKKWYDFFSLAIQKVHADEGGEGGGGTGGGEFGGECFNCVCTGTCTQPPVVCYGGSAVFTRDACSFNANSPATSPEGSVITYYPFAPAGYTGNWSYVCGGDGLWHETSFSCVAPAPPAPTVNIRFD